MARPIELIQSSFSLSESARKNMVEFGVESSKAEGLRRTSSAPFTVRQSETGITPRGMPEGDAAVVGSLNQKSLPCLRTNQRRRQSLKTDLCSPVN
ncbi:hypothetical protein Lal_00028264 [Lupinus albus]|nr:hypothetical protein Lal_00028264 [Lupinus albus]